MERSWQPLITKNSLLQRECLEAVEAIVDDIYYKRYPRPRRAHNAYEDSLLYLYYANAAGLPEWMDRAVESLNEAIEHAWQLRHSPALFDGACGLGWVTTHIREALLHLDPTDGCSGDVDGEDPVTEIDQALLRQLRTAEWRDTYDLIGGLVGFGTYFLERPDSPESREGVALVVTHLRSMSVRQDIGRSWFTGADLLPGWQRERFPNGYFNLGMAHGIPGVLHLLFAVSQSNYSEIPVADLLEDGLRWLLSVKNPSTHRSWFGCWASELPVEDSRLAWCYGDLGILAVLFQIGASGTVAGIKDFAEGLLSQCLDRNDSTSGVVDAPLCHGAAGVGHVFSRIYQTNGSERCRDQAVDWFRQALAFRRPGHGVGGFSVVTKPDPSGPRVLEPSPAFLDGAIGVGLSLISAIAPVEPQWDRMMLLSTRPRGNV